MPYSSFRPNTTIPEKPSIPCPQCGSRLRLRAAGAPGRFFYGCNEYPRCKCTQTADKNGDPIGVPATSEVRTARQIFEIKSKHLLVQKNQDMPAEHYYSLKNRFWHWMAEELGIPFKECSLYTLSAQQLHIAAQICEHTTLAAFSEWYDRWKTIQENKQASKGQRRYASKDQRISAQLLN